MYHVPLALQCIYECSDEGDENWDGEESEISGGGKRRLPSFLYADDLVFCDELRKN